MKNDRQRVLLLAALGAFCAASPDGSAAESAQGWAGGLASMHWRLPDTANGLRPTQSWSGAASAADGNIYVGGMDHATNSALYRLEPQTGVLRYVGDARSASEAAHNWVPGETAQKFHTRPLWHRGKIYVATLDRSSLDDAYLSRRGFHWYSFDPARDSFTDLSAAEPGGASAEHGGLVTAVADPDRNVIYGASVPTGEIFRYDVARGRTEKLGRPGVYKPYVYAGRVMWVDSRGRLYFTAGNPNWGSYNPAIYGHVYYYDPRSGFGERTDWLLQEPRALDQSQCLPDPKRCFVADDHGHIYRFDDDGPSWSYLGQVEGPPGQLWLWTLDISADGEKAYLSSSSPLEDASPLSLYEFDLTTGATRELCRFAALDGEVARFRHHFGADAWDAEGRFYLTSFTPGSGRNVILTRIDPVRLKAALGLLPAVTEVSLTRTPESQGASLGFAFARTGSTRTPQKVIYRLVATDAQGGMRERHGTVVIPTGASAVSVGLRELQSGGREEVTHGVLSVVPNGDDYVAGANRSVSF